jgi:hypothetical protein
MNTKIVLGSLAGAALLHGLLSACSKSNGGVASADEATVQVAVEKCDKTYQYTPPPGPDSKPITEYYAEHAYPGLTKEQIAGHVTNWNAVAPPDFVPSTGYSLTAQDVLYVKDGFVGANCAQGGTTTFIYAP